MIENDKKIEIIKNISNKYIEDMTLGKLFENEYIGSYMEILKLISYEININIRVKDLTDEQVKLVDTILRDNSEYRTLNIFINKVKKCAIIKQFNELKF